MPSKMMDFNTKQMKKKYTDNYEWGLPPGPHGYML